jgi:outer membrane murein-binding lipoprotein Lpp
LVIAVRDTVQSVEVERAMSDGPDSLILVYLRRIDEKLDRLMASVADLSHRVTSLESKVALLHGDFAAQSERIDRIEARLDRIERRLEIVPA